MIRYFEDVDLGTRVDLGTFTFTADKIMAFAQRFDPQPFHLSAEAGRNSLFGGLAASGWQTAAVWMKMWVDHVKQHIAAGTAPADAMGPSPGFDDLKWLKPVLADDTVSYTAIANEKRPLASKPEWGLVSGLGEGFNQRQEAVFSFNYHVFVRRRPLQR